MCFTFVDISRWVSFITPRDVYVSPHDGHVGYRAWIGVGGVGGNYEEAGHGRKRNGIKNAVAMHEAVGEDLEEVVHHLCFFDSLRSLIEL